MQKAPIVNGVECVQKKKKWTVEVHDVWQIDGKEQVLLSNGDKVSWMNIADEASSSHLKAGVVNCETVVLMDAQQATQIVNDAFHRWGLPKQIKIDNGYPFVNPKHLKNPTKTKLWWIGLGINVIQNTPRCPQQNGAVECLQGIMKNWSNPKDQDSHKDLQKRLDQESDFQRNDYQIPSKGYQTRIELHPSLEKNTRRYDSSNFNMELVYKYLSEQVWMRYVYRNGSIKFFGEEIYIGTKFSKEDLSITFDPVNRVWLIRKLDGTLLRTSAKGIPIEQEIKDFAICQ